MAIFIDISQSSTMMKIDMKKQNPNEIFQKVRSPNNCDVIKQNHQELANTNLKI